MIKLTVKLIDGDIKENAVLNIKDNSFVIKTDAGELIKIPYNNIESYKYNESNKLTFHLLDGNNIVIKCKLNEQLKTKLEEIVSQPKVQPKEKVQEHDKVDKVKKVEKSSNSKKYNGTVFLPRGQTNCDVTLNKDNLTIESGSEILIIPYNSIIRLELTDNNDIKILSNNNNNFVIRCKNIDVLYRELKKSKSNSTYESSSNVKVQDVFGNDVIKVNTQNGSGVKILVIISIIIGIIFMFKSCVNSSDSPANTIQWDIRDMGAKLGYGTRYTIGEVISASCHEEENDGNGRYIIRCNVQYYPKRNNGAIATDSKMDETIYAVFLRKDNNNFSRRYTSIITDSFKTKTCWGKAKSEGLFCNN